MKNMVAAALVLAAVGFAGSAQAECLLKEAPALPDGATAVQDDMVKAQQAVKAYVAETQEYLSCLEFEGKGKSGGDWTKKYNDASSRMEKLAAEFNKQLRAFKSK